MDHRSQVIMAAMLGAGVVIGTAGVFIYNQLFGEQRQRLAHQANEIRKLDETMTEIRAELAELRKRRSRRKTEVDSDDMFSAIGTDDDDDEFFDLSDDETENEPVETEPLLINLFRRVDVKFEGTNKDREWCREQMLDHLEVFPDNGALLWRLAKCNHKLSKTETDADFRTRLEEQGLHFAQRSVEAEPRSAEANKWYAILVGEHAEKQGGKERIRGGLLYKKHVDIAIRLAPSDPGLHFLAGRFHYEVANISWFERKLASTFFADPPTATLQDAHAHFIRAEQLSKEPFRENRLFLAKTNAALGDFKQALYWLNLSLQSPNVTAEDAALESEARILVTKYSSKHT